MTQVAYDKNYTTGGATRSFSRVFRRPLSFLWPSKSFWTRYLRYRVPKNEYVVVLVVVVVVLPIYLQYTHSLLTILGNGTILFWLCSIEQYCCILTELYDFYDFNYLKIHSNIFQMQKLTLNMTEYLSILTNSWNIIVYS